MALFLLGFWGNLETEMDIARLQWVTARRALGWGLDLLSLYPDFLFEPFPPATSVFSICKICTVWGHSTGPGMLSQRLLRLASPVSCRRMKLLLHTAHLCGLCLGQLDYHEVHSGKWGAQNWEQAWRDHWTTKGENQGFGKELHPEILASKIFIRKGP